jgi:hypothetical protein
MPSISTEIYTLSFCACVRAAERQISNRRALALPRVVLDMMYSSLEF